MENQNRFVKSLRKAYLWYDRMMEKQGFYVVLAVCVLVIVISAVYTFRLREEESRIVTAKQAETAGGNQNAETLEEARELIASQNAPEMLEPVPTESPLKLQQPVPGFVDREFSLEEPQFFAASGMWQIHAGIDLTAEYGTPVQCCLSGRVSRVWKDNEKGLTVMISHEGGYQSVYAGLSSADYVRQGDEVVKGQTIGHVGNGVLAESDAQPHLHFEIHREGKPVDPLAVFLGIDK
ncbi:MAG: M23 family metallopeptidase [Clostridiales bacterium]|nr:M23 family metallopeptidase [Clostridiales bacterium]